MKNMKLTNLSLSVLIALGLVACGGSDNKDNAPLDKDQHGEAGGNGGNGGKPEVTPEHTGTLPQRYSPSLNVPDDLKGQVASRKRFTVRRGFADPALGYTLPGKPVEYQKAHSTDPEDIKRKSVYSYVKEKDLITVSTDGKTVTGGFEKGAKGAISIGWDVKDKSTFHTDQNEINAWVKLNDGKYYRVRPNKEFAKYDADTEFTIVENGVTAAALGDKEKDKIKQSDLVFIANADTSRTSIKLGGAQQYILSDPTKQKEVILDKVSVFGNNFDVEALNQNFDLSDLSVNTKEIQKEKITGKYHLLNTKGTPYNDDDKIVHREATLGYVKAYNLPHTIAFVTTNADMSGEKNVFNLDGNGAFQLNGLETPSLPKDGRANYAGKSFSADVEGKVELTADFFENEAGIFGRVFDRKQVSTGDSLAELTLEKIALSSPTHHATGSNYGVVKGDNDYADNWTVQIYGMDAQEAGGFLRKLAWKEDKDKKQVIDFDNIKIKEVYTSQRQTLGNKSNDSTVK